MATLSFVVQLASRSGMPLEDDENKKNVIKMIKSGPYVSYAFLSLEYAILEATKFEKSNFGVHGVKGFSYRLPSSVMSQKCLNRDAQLFSSRQYIKPN